MTGHDVNSGLTEPKITGWHATRVLSEEEIRHGGLKAYSKTERLIGFTVYTISLG